jgi:hypothetical protein
MHLHQTAELRVFAIPFPKVSKLDQIGFLKNLGATGIGKAMQFGSYQ